MTDVQPPDSPDGLPDATPKITRKPTVLGRLGRIIVVALVLLAGGHYAWQRFLFGRAYESTDDAFIDRQITQISSRVAGPIVKLYVGDNQPVKADDPLAEIDPTDYRQAVARAQSAVDVVQRGPPRRRHMPRRSS